MGLWDKRVYSTHDGMEMIQYLGVSKAAVDLEKFPGGGLETRPDGRFVIGHTLCLGHVYWFNRIRHLQL